METNQANGFDGIDLLKVVGYGLTVGSAVAALAGNRKDAEQFRSLATIFGGFTGFLDLMESPKHCGRRTWHDEERNCYVCGVCCGVVPFEPQLGF